MMKSCLRTCRISLLDHLTINALQPCFDNFLDHFCITLRNARQPFLTSCLKSLFHDGGYSKKSHVKPTSYIYAMPQIVNKYHQTYSKTWILWNQRRGVRWPKAAASLLMVGRPTAAPSKIDIFDLFGNLFYRFDDVFVQVAFKRPGFLKVLAR